MATLVGCENSGTFLKIDHNSGSSSLIGQIGFLPTNSLARDVSGKLYSAPSALITINPSSGAGTFVKNLQPPTDIRGLAFSAANVLFGIKDGGLQNGTFLPDILVTINTATGAVTSVGSIGRSRVQGLTFSSGGLLYGWDLTYGLLTINTSTGAGTLVSPGTVPGSVVDIQSLAFAPDGTLYGASATKLYRVSTNNGATTIIGSGGYSDLRGIEFLKERGGLKIPIVRYAWIWTILIGYILITPIGPICIVCGDPISGLLIRGLGALTMAIGGLGLWNELSPGQR